jgi:hypothetical protein
VRGRGVDALTSAATRRVYFFVSATHRNAALTAEQMGHKNARMLYAHYREVVKDAEDSVEE